MGSKARIAKDIVPIIQSYIDKYESPCYIEPFVGGGNVIDKIYAPYSFGIDNNKYLIALLDYVKPKKSVIEHKDEYGVEYSFEYSYNELPKSVSKEEYDLVRDYYNKSSKIVTDSSSSTEYAKFPDWLVGCVGFLASYNGRFFDGGYAKPTVTYKKKGVKIRNYYDETSRNIMKQVRENPAIFSNIIFEYGDYKEWEDILNGHFRLKGMYLPSNPYVIYCDPPYRNVKKYSSSQNFDYEEFWDKVREWSKNHVVLISSNYAPEDFDCIWSKSIKYTMNAKHKEKEKSQENLYILSSSKFHM